jgi:hypothetical protein
MLKSSLNSPVMKKKILILAVILFSGAEMMAQIYLPVSKEGQVGLKIKNTPVLKNEVNHPVESADFQWRL